MSSDSPFADRTMSSLAIILVNRLVLNLRERAVIQLPTTVETAGRFQAALPIKQSLQNDCLDNESSYASSDKSSTWSQVV